MSDDTRQTTHTFPDDKTNTKTTPSVEDHLAARKLVAEKKNLGTCFACRSSFASGFTIFASKLALFPLSLSLPT